MILLVLLLHNTRAALENKVVEEIFLAQLLYLDSFTVKDIFQYSVVKKGASKQAIGQVLFYQSDSQLILNWGAAEPLDIPKNFKDIAQILFLFSYFGFVRVPQN